MKPKDGLVGGHTPKGEQFLLRNSVWNSAAFAVALLVNLAILPFVVAHLGVSSFGVVGLVTACVASAQVFGNSLGLSTIRELALKLDPSDRAEAQRLFATAALLAIAVGGGIAMVLIVGGPPLARLGFHLGDLARDDLQLAFALSGIGWWCQCLSAVLLALFTARQDYRRIATISAISTIVYGVSTLLLVPIAPNASTFLGCQALSFLSSLLMALYWVPSVLGKWLALPALDRAALGKLIKLGGWQLTAQAGALLSGHADRYLLGALLQPQFVGFYGIAQRLEEAVYIGVLKVSEILFPFFSSLHKETDERKIDLLFRSLWVLNVLAASALGGLVPVAGALLSVWTGPEVARQAERLLVVLSIAGILGSTANVFGFYLLAQGKSGYNAIIALLTGLSTLATSVITLPYFGWQAAGWSACVGMTVQLVTTLFLLRRTFDHAGLWLRMLHLLVMPLIVSIGAALAARFGLAYVMANSKPSWLYVAVTFAVSSWIVLILAVAASQLGPYRLACRQDIRTIIERFSSFRAN